MPARGIRPLARRAREALEGACLACGLPAGDHRLPAAVMLASAIRHPPSSAARPLPGRPRLA